MRARALLAEIVRTILSQRFGSLIVSIMVAGTCFAVVMTTGRTVAAGQQVLATLDSAGTRSIIVRADPSAGLLPAVIARVDTISDVTWSAGFGPPTDARNTAVRDRPAVPVRTVFTKTPENVGAPSTLRGLVDVGWAPKEVFETLGAESIATVASSLGQSFSISAIEAWPDGLALLESTILTLGEPSESTPITMLIVVVDSPSAVAPVSSVVASLLSVSEPTKVQISSSESLAELRTLVEGQLNVFGRTLALGIFAVTLVLEASILYGLVMFRRKDFGRRRALGASQRLIVGLVVGQAFLLSSVGAVGGVGLSVLTLSLIGDAVPSVAYLGAVATIAAGVACLASITPAVAAARRDPLSELRVP